jgi:hypothetical protein
MMRIPFKPKMLVQAAVLAGAVSLSSPASAMFVDDVALNAQFATYSAGVTAFIAAFWTWTNTILMPAISGATQAVSESQIQALSKATDSAISLAHAQTAAVIANRYTVTDPCSIGAMAGVGGGDPLRSAPAAGAGASYRGGSGSVSRPSTPLGRALAISEGTVPRPAVEVTAAIGASAGCNAFATGARANDCTAAKLPPTQAGGYPDADVSAATLIDGPQAAGEHIHRMSVDMDTNSPAEMAIKAFRRNIEWSANEPRSLTAGELQTEAGRRFLGIRDAYDAKMSLARMPTDHHLTMISSSTSTIQAIQDMMKSATDTAYLQSYLAQFKPNWQTKGVSPDELLNIDVNRHYFNLDYVASVAQMEPAEVAREQLRQQALTNVLLQRLGQEQRIAGLVAGGQLAAATRAEMIPDLKAAHNAAIR